MSLFRVHVGEGWGINVAGADGIDGDAGAGDFFGKGLGKSKNTSFGSGVIGLAGWGEQSA